VTFILQFLNLGPACDIVLMRYCGLCLKQVISV